MQKKWWHEKVAYQIYPKSFYDTNGDGIGDLRGIINKLDYLKELGIDIIWISPIYCSPLADQGYDISDYRKIDPRFGTMEDMDELLAEAKKRDMHILMDLVVNHCSDEHEWFRKACEDPNGKYGKYFYIETVKDGKLPTNWRSYFGGSVWEKLPGHDDKYYLHLFHKKQPDLNWENKEVREEIYDMINWWLEKGLSGFRIDAIINIKKVLPWKDYPADRDDGLVNLGPMLEEAVGVGDFLTELRDRTFKKYNAFTVGEVFNEKEGELPLFIGEDGYFSSMFDFNATVWGTSDKGWYDCKHITPDAFRDCSFAGQRKAEGIGFPANVIENHDEPRGVSRYIPAGDCSDTSKKMLATIQFMLKGLPFIYQGQEIGMENVDFTSIEQIDDVSSQAEYVVAKNAGLSDAEALDVVKFFSRDNARTPFHWNETAHAGFTTGTPWLTVNPNYTDINLADQLHRQDSVYAYYKTLIALRKNPEYKDVIVYGTCIPIWETEHNLMAFYRKTEEKTLLVIANYQNDARTISLEDDVKHIVLNNLDNCELTNNQLTLSGYQVVVLEV